MNYSERIKIKELPFNTKIINIFIKNNYEYLDEIINIHPYEFVQKFKGFGISNLRNYELVVQWWKMLKLIESLENDDNSIPKSLWDLRNKIIQEIKNK